MGGDRPGDRPRLADGEEVPLARRLRPSAGGDDPPPARKKVIDDYAPLIDAMLAKERRLQATTIHQRLVVEHGFCGSYQRTKLYEAEARERIWPEAPELHRRFEVLPGAQAQVDWGDEGFVDGPDGPVHVWSFHMTLSFSRDPFCCFVTSQDLVTFWDCHRRAFDHFGGVPATIVYDRTRTVSSSTSAATRTFPCTPGPSPSPPTTDRHASTVVPCPGADSTVNH